MLIKTLTSQYLNVTQLTLCIKGHLSILYFVYSGPSANDIPTPLGSQNAVLVAILGVVTGRYIRSGIKNIFFVNEFFFQIHTKQYLAVMLKM